ncbi:AlpA family phage regulatory protein [Colwellia sp. RSH04]|uniref:AlpA family phage regulatory protein n=1 Tax=Colwellia sp. RSH04 TaxID=2305464 RepID=UPI000E58AB45|nr:AlpA family phage regulatory protein [Colwellia sp. RSH04]RHW75776.1 AlpA family phage regulatory protein [Colwellia sp. RSH04]
MTAQYTQPTPEKRKELLQIVGESDRLVKDLERKKLTTLSRTQTWKLEKQGLHPQRRQLSTNSVAWLLSDLLWFIYKQEPTSNTNKKSNS